MTTDKITSSSFSVLALRWEHFTTGHIRLPPWLYFYLFIFLWFTDTFCFYLIQGKFGALYIFGHSLYDCRENSGNPEDLKKSAGIFHIILLK